jgi:hypothetical protein
MSWNVKREREREDVRLTVMMTLFMEEGTMERLHATKTASLAYIYTMSATGSRRKTLKKARSVDDNHQGAVFEGGYAPASFELYAVESS